MPDPAAELLTLADAIAAAASHAELDAEMKALNEAALNVGRAWSGSTLGYHANVYYEGLRPPPPGQRFSQEWGLMDSYMGDSYSPGFEEHDPEYVKAHIIAAAGKPDIAEGRKTLKDAERAFRNSQEQVRSVLSLLLEQGEDQYIRGRLTALNALSAFDETNAVRALVPSRGTVMSRDTAAVNGGTRAGPHHYLRALPAAIGATQEALVELESITRQAAAHAARRAPAPRRKLAEGSHIFIGHGRSRAWRDLKDFIGERLKLPYDEFNREFAAGITTVSRLERMLTSSAFAFLVMTAEDELADGDFQARMNVVHEVGLFQGHLGFNKAIVLLEEGCKEFSNIAGLGHIRFPKGNIAAAFEDVRRVLERETIIKAD